MTDTAILADTEEQAATRAILAAAMRKNMTVADFALSAFVQNAMTQAVLQALVRMLKQKNLVSEAEIDRCLAAAYHDARAEAEGQGVIVSPTQRPQGSH